MKASKSLGFNPPDTKKDCISEIVRDVDSMNPTDPSALSFSTASRILLVASSVSCSPSKSRAITTINFLLRTAGNFPELTSDLSSDPILRLSLPLDQFWTAASILLFLSMEFPSWFM
ncbi:hypothetical protein CARUB_v10002280mg [Capsella rubella]|uniref:Uncharacterized protein n=1 Tax=Capsella rubella TaxID=81985 RepID=R0H9Z6_9BRAS|nr:hypothetical protein CARUB_v10002280mg [Capsella rubella]